MLWLLLLLLLLHWVRCDGRELVVRRDLIRDTAERVVQSRVRTTNNTADVHTAQADTGLTERAVGAGQAER